MKFNWKTTLKTIGKVAVVGAGGAIAASPETQQMIVAAIPPPWNMLAGMGLGFLALQLRPVGKTAEPTVTESKR